MAPVMGSGNDLNTSYEVSFFFKQWIPLNQYFKIAALYFNLIYN